MQNDSIYYFNNTIGSFSITKSKVWKLEINIKSRLMVTFYINE